MFKFRMHLAYFLRLFAYYVDPRPATKMTVLEAQAQQNAAYRRMLDAIDG